MVCDVELLHRLDPRRARGFRADAVELERQRDVLDRGQPRQQVEVLEDVADRAASHPRPIRARDAREVDAVDEHLAAARLLEAARDRQQRTLAGAARAHDGDQLAALDRRDRRRRAPAPPSARSRRPSIPGAVRARWSLRDLHRVSCFGGMSASAAGAGAAAASGARRRHRASGRSLRAGRARRRRRAPAPRRPRRPPP